jgi:hypothetical protein
MSHFAQKGFQNFLSSGEFSDLVLVLKNDPKQEPVEYKVHKLILASNSDFFKQLLYNDFRETVSGRVEIGFADPDGVFNDVLRFLYTGKVNITRHNAVALLASADHYLIESLKSVCLTFINEMIHRDNAFSVLQQAIRYRVSDVMEICVGVVARNFWRIDATHDFSEIPWSVFISVLEHPVLAIKEESTLFKCICKFIADHKGKISPEEITKMFDHVRFPWLSYDELVAAGENPYVPKEQLTTALLLRLGRHEQKSSESLDISSERLKPRKTFGVMFDYNEAKGKQQFHGIMWHIATAKGAEEWRNPHYTKRVCVSASSIEKGDFRELVGLTPSELWTKDVPASWFMVDLGPGRSVICTFYTLRHGGNYRADSLRNWDFQGYHVESQSWDVLRRHTDDSSLNGPYAMRTFPIESTKAYRAFRVLQTGHNSSNHNYLVLSGIELYGELYETEEGAFEWMNENIV